MKTTEGPSLTPAVGVPGKRPGPSSFGRRGGML